MNVKIIKKDFTQNRIEIFCVENSLKTFYIMTCHLGVGDIKGVQYILYLSLHDLYQTRLENIWFLVMLTHVVSLLHHWQNQIDQTFSVIPFQREIARFIISDYDHNMCVHVLIWTSMNICIYKRVKHDHWTISLFWIKQILTFTEIWVFHIQYRVFLVLQILIEDCETLGLK